METVEHIDSLRLQGALLADAAVRAGLDAPVPPCPAWQVKDVLRHTGFVHRWAARHITERPDAVLDGPSEEEILRGGATDAELLAWFRAGHAALVETLSQADPGLVCPVFMAAPSPLAFWARRQAHETAIHRADAECAAGMMPEYPADFADDGIDELITGFGGRRKYRPQAGAAADGQLLRVVATDTGGAWSIETCQGRLEPRRETAPNLAGRAACTVSGPACGLYLYLWNRADPAGAGVTITGDLALLASWQGAVKVRWD